MRFSEVLNLKTGAPLCLWLSDSFAGWQSKFIYIDSDHVAKGQDSLSAPSLGPPSSCRLEGLSQSSSFPHSRLLPEKV